MTEVGNGHAPMTGAGRGQTVSVAEAAGQMGVSARTVRRYIKAGTLPGELVTTSKGNEWRVSAAAVASAVSDRGALTAAGGVSGPSEDSRGHPRLATEPAVRRGRGETAPLLRTLDLLAERDRRISQLEQERFELAGRLGYLQAELAQARDKIKALQAPKEPIAPPPPAGAIFAPPPAEPEPPRRRWWWPFGGG
jgi:excisionase family DNA binding protein